VFVVAMAFAVDLLSYADASPGSTRLREVKAV